jgi:hypothetical protein
MEFLEATDIDFQYKESARSWGWYFTIFFIYLPYEARRLVYIQPTLIFKYSEFCPQNVFTGFVWFSE